MNTDALARMEATRAALAELNATHEPKFYVEVNEAQLADLAAAFVPVGRASGGPHLVGL